MPAKKTAKHALTEKQDSILNGVIRHILTAAGGFLVSKGAVTDGQLEIAIGAIIAIAGVAWSAIAKKKSE